jgi:hypothetical protein
MRGVKLALTLGLAALALAIGVALSHAPMTVARTPGIPSEEERMVTTTHGGTYCQPNETLPRGTTAIRPWLLTFTGPRVRVVVYSDRHPIASGERESGWTSREVTIPVKPLGHTVSGVTVCVSFALHDETLVVFGEEQPHDRAYGEHGQLSGRMLIEYLRPGSRSWASLIGSTLDHIGLGRSAGGTWIALLAIGLLVTVAVVASRTVLKELA